MFWLPMSLALTALGLLLVFQSVVRQGVRLGDQRRQETAQREEATWRCKALPEHRLRMACLGDLGIFPAPLKRPLAGTEEHPSSPAPWSRVLANPGVARFAGVQPISLRDA